MTINPFQTNLALDQAKSVSLNTMQARDDAKIKETARDFEALFIEMLFKEMKKTVKSSGFMGENSPAYDIFDSMLGQEYAKTASASGGIGLAKVIEDSLKPRAVKRP